ncbi:hypothetical protein NLJ89_g5173 [Agrocybe chaxingu]|uniref:Uncharacterized protein n=1 Tax=Agrocybe chaxingu TaxID=84603 RepID=A0A9W8MXF9_9AGAR|nr:hypothetical protein NLJ89_g5173 [Agrocybe chaxingu]
MPGPSNNKKRTRGRVNNCKRKSTNLPKPQPTRFHGSTTPSPPSSPSPPQTPPPLLKFESPYEHKKLCPVLDEKVSRTVEKVMFQPPFIHDPGNGPRVRDARAFMGSFFAQPPSLDDPLCAEFAQDEVLQMLSTVLPEETALILWYNKSRSRSRICPSCQRLYRLGDALQDLVDEDPEPDKPRPPQLLLEQEISGLCSPVCFILASFNYPGAIKLAWGRMADEMDDSTWELLNGPGVGVAENETSRTLGMLVRMTRLHDLGLAQLCFGVDVEEASLLQVAHS